MGKRSRKRASPDAPPRRGPIPDAVPSTRGRPVQRKARLEEAPPALWSPVPLTELLILVGLVLTVVGFFTGGFTLLLVGLLLISVSALELAIREHFAGYRSHSSLLATTAAAAIVAPLYLAGLPGIAMLAAAAVVAGLAFQQLRMVFARRAGGLKFRA